MALINAYTVVYDKNLHPKLHVEKEITCESESGLCRADIVRALQQGYNIRKLASERIFIVSMDSQGRIQGICELSRGTETEVSFYVRDMAIVLLLLGCYEFIVIHNHPNGSADISENDVIITRMMQGMAVLLGFKMIDHYIVAKRRTVSLKDMGAYVPDMLGEVY